MHETCLAAVLTKPGQISIEKIRLKPPSAGEALLRIKHVGVCGTDVSIFRGEYDVPLPLVPGHEISAVVEAVGRRDFEHLHGYRVVCEINNSCRAYHREQICEACRRDISTHCLERTVTGIIGHQGAMAQRLIAPIGNLHVVPEDISDRQAILVEPLAAAIRTFELTPLNPGDVVVVLGCGRLGKMIALVASKLDATVVAVGRSRAHLEQVSPYAEVRVAFGPDTSSHGDVICARSEDELKYLIREHTKGLGADVVVEATASNQNLRIAQQLVRPLGTIALKSTCGQPVPLLDTTFTAVNEIRLQGSRCGPFQKAIDFMLKYRQPDESWITAEFPLERAADAIAAARHEPKVIISPDSTPV